MVSELKSDAVFQKALSAANARLSGLMHLKPTAVIDINGKEMYAVYDTETECIVCSASKKENIIYALKKRL